MYQMTYNWWAVLLRGIVALLLGVLLVVFPSTGFLIWLWWVGAYAVVSGIMLIILSFRLRKEEKRPHTTTLA